MRRLLKRFVSGLAAVGLLATLLTGCGGGGTPDQPTVGPTDMGEITYTAPEEENIEEDVTSEGSYFVNNEILLTGVENATKDELAALVRPYGGSIVGYIALTNDCQIRFAQTYTIDELQNIVDELKLNEKVEVASIHSLMETTSDAIPDDSEWANEEWSAEYPEGKNWGMEAIDAMGAWEYRSQMQDVKVGIIDSMFDTDHEDLDFVQVWNNPDNIASSDEGDKSDRSHGTHVSGTIAAKYNNGTGVAGVAPTAKLYGYSMLGSTTDSTLLEHQDLTGMMEWKYALAKMISADCRVINVSMCRIDKTISQEYSTAQGEILGAYLKKFLDKGYDFLIVQAAGNGQEVTGWHGYKATRSGLFVDIQDEEVKKHIIIVGAVGTKGSTHDGFLGIFGDRVFKGYGFPDFSCYGSRVDVVAPGVKIYSTVPNNKYANMVSLLLLQDWSGTSMAAPHVTGIAADCFAVNPALSGEQVKNIIKSTCSTLVTDNNSSHTDYEEGESRVYRMVNAKYAVEEALHTSGNVEAPVNPSEIVVLGHVRDAQNGTSLENVAITAYRVSTHDGNLSDYAASATTDSDGNFELILEAGTYNVGIFAEGYQPFAYANLVVEAGDEPIYLDTAVLVDESEDRATMSGYAINALTGSNISGVTVKFRPGWDRKVGALAKIYDTDTDAVTTTNSDGRYTVDLMEGNYTAEFSKEGFVTGYANVVCFKDNSADQDCTLTPVMAENEYRIVLTWGDTPRDLDSHLSGPIDDEDNRFHVFYSNRSASTDTEDGYVTVAKLDHDDTSSYGPETITLIQLFDEGVYHYAVHDFTNRNSTDSTALSMSGAKIVVYHNNEAAKVYHVPVNKVGTVWNVFDIRDGQIVPVNTMENISNPSSVTMNDGISTYELYDEPEEVPDKEETFEEEPMDEEYYAELRALELPDDDATLD